jgi:hypothetical protein
MLSKKVMLNSINRKPRQPRLAGHPTGTMSTTCTPAAYAGAEPARPLPSASNGVMMLDPSRRARFQAVSLAQARFRQSGAISPAHQRVPTGCYANASR